MLYKLVLFILDLPLCFTDYSSDNRTGQFETPASYEYVQWKIACGEEGMADKPQPPSA